MQQEQHELFEGRYIALSRSQRVDTPVFLNLAEQAADHAVYQGFA